MQRYPKLNRRPLKLNRPADLLDMMDEIWSSQITGLPAEKVFPAIDVSESENQIKVTAEIPGMNADDIDLSMENNTLIIQGEKQQEQEEEKENPHQLERTYGSFYRSIPLPCECSEEDIQASFKNGVLTVRLPKRGETETRKKIKIQS